MFMGIYFNSCMHNIDILFLYFLRVLYAMSRDKDVRTCVHHIIGVTLTDRIHFAQVKIVNCLLRRSDYYREDKV